MANSHTKIINDRTNRLATWCAALAVLCWCGRLPAEEVSFSNDCMAVLSKAGCNLGVCHGNQNGKGGFKLSLRGQDPELDRLALTHDQLGRRANPLNPERSLILLKPTAQVAHQGGRRFAVDSEEYEILRRWVAAGMPADPSETPRLVRLEVTPTEQVLIEPEASVQLRATASLSDGSRRDVTTLAVYEPASQIVEVDHDGLVRRLAYGETTVLVRYLQAQVPVRLAFVPERPDYVWQGPPEANFIDRHVFAKLRSLRTNPSELAGDSVFLRRAYLDAIGLPPTADEARAFLADTRSDKRARLIDQLLERPELADCWALKWSDLLRNEEKVLDPKGVANFHHWIRQSIVEAKPLDQFVRELITARGSTYTNPPANFYRANRDPVTRAEAAAQLFLGVRLQCAKCHNHPFDRWTQGDYYRWAGFFARVRYKIVENRRRDINDGHEFDGEQVVWMADDGEVRDPRTEQPMAPCFLGEPTPQFPPDQDRLEELAAWMTSAENPFFARAQVNRIWFHLLGRGIVDPIDDFRATNPASIPALLDELAREFVEHRFDLRHVVRLIMSSSTYQLSAAANDTNQDDLNFSHAFSRRLSAEELLDAMSQVTGVPPRFSGFPQGLRATQLPGVQAMRFRNRAASRDDQFLVLFGKPPRLLTCECERSTEATLGQAFQLVSGPAINELLTNADNRLGRLLADPSKQREAMLDELYLAALSRFPSEPERAASLDYLNRADDPRAALEDITWSLLNAKEFLLRH